MLHICFITHEYPPAPHGGIGSFVQTLARALVQAGHRATVVGTVPPDWVGERFDQGVRVIGVPESRLRFMGVWLNENRLRQAVRDIHQQHPIDVLESAELDMAAFPRSFPVKKLIRMQGGHLFFAATLGSKPRRLRAWVERRSFAHADFFCAVSRFAAETTRELHHLGDQRIEIIPNPVDVDLFHPQPEVVPTAGRILFVGTVTRKKGVYELVRAMTSILDAVPDAHLHIAGRDTCDPQTGESTVALLKKLVPSQVETHITFLGTQLHENIPMLLSQAQVAVYPSYMETQGIAWVEGLAAGKAVVASHLGPGREIIEDGESGILCDPRQPKEIAAAVLRLLQNSMLRARMGQAARERAVMHFSLQPLLQRNLVFYREIIGGS